MDKGSPQTDARAMLLDDLIPAPRGRNRSHAIGFTCGSIFLDISIYDQDKSSAGRAQRVRNSPVPNNVRRLLGNEIKRSFRVAKIDLSRLVVDVMAY